MITLTGDTALQIYAQNGVAEEILDSPSCNGLDWGHGRAKDLQDIEELGITPSPDHPVDVLVDHRDHRIQSSKVVNHVCQSALPPHAVVRLAPGVLIVTPEFCFLEAAKKGVALAAAIGMECCGAYGRDDSPRGFSDRAPITNLASPLSPERLSSGSMRALTCAASAMGPPSLYGFPVATSV